MKEGEKVSSGVAHRDGHIGPGTAYVEIMLHCTRTTISRQIQHT